MIPLSFSLLLSWLIAPTPAAPEMIPAAAMEVLNHPAPPFTLPLLRGGTFDLAQQQGKTVVLSFWASWCTPCRMELPELSKLAAERKDLVVIAVNVDRDKAAAERFLQSVPGINVPVALDPEASVMGNYLVLSMPTMFAIDSKGIVRYQRVGYSREKGLSELISALETMK